MLRKLLRPLCTGFISAALNGLNKVVDDIHTRKRKYSNAEYHVQGRLVWQIRVFVEHANGGVRGGGASVMGGHKAAMFNHDRRWQFIAVRAIFLACPWA